LAGVDDFEEGEANDGSIQAAGDLEARDEEESGHEGGRQPHPVVIGERQQRCRRDDVESTFQHRLRGDDEDGGVMDRIVATAWHE
jgi:hypothetical protein